MYAARQYTKDGADARVVWVDQMRGFLISLVVLGHVVGGAGHMASKVNASFYSLLYLMIYVFHMPAFFFLSGVTWRRSTTTFLEFFGKKFIRLIVPYFIWGVMSIFVYLLFSGEFSSVLAGTDGYYAKIKDQKFSWWRPFISLLHGGGWPHGEGFRCNSVLWFLPCLFSLQLGYFWLDRMVTSRRGQMIILMVCFLFGFFMRSKGFYSLPWGVGRIPEYLSFMVAGRWFSEWNSLNESWQKAMSGFVWVVCGLLVAGYLGTCCLLPNLWFAYSRFGWYLLFSAMAIWGIAITVILSHLIKWRWLVSLGGLSLGVMLSHKFLVFYLQVKVPFFRELEGGGLFQSLVICTIVFLMSVGVSYVLARIVRYYCPWALGTRRR